MAIKPAAPRHGMWLGRKSTQENLWKALVYVILGVGAIVVALPFLWMLSTSLKTYDQVMVFPPRWIPKPAAWANYPMALQYIPFLQYLKNTVFVTTISVIGVLMASSFVAYGFARIEAPGKKFLFGVLLASMMLPGQVTMIPVYVLFRMLGWMDNFKPLTIPAFLGGGAFNIFLFRQFYLTIPAELSDAARIDGCSNYGIWWRIMLPLTKPALATVGIFSFMANWSDFWSPLIYLNSQEKYTLALGLQLFQSLHSTEYSLLMAASLVVSLPILAVFFFAQKYFIEGVTLTGMKG